MRARVIEGLNLAAAAKVAVEDIFSTVGTTGVASYGGTASTTAASSGQTSYAYEYAAGSNVASITIAAIPVLATPAMEDGQIAITYAANVGSALGAPLLLTPGSGGVTDSAFPAAPMRLSQPIVWGCGIANAAALKYLPANCRYVVP
ncbi:pilin [Comamonas endophytica]|uniref:Pilin n=1 Tax=Comamonas endophytica TaxID=2949090 RepID=A0ABY6GFL6_9BURK|nr:pilin [Acidovorax sp. 5MLIR]